MTVRNLLSLARSARFNLFSRAFLGHAVLLTSTACVLSLAGCAEGGSSDRRVERDAESVTVREKPGQDDGTEPGQDDGTEPDAAGEDDAAMRPRPVELAPDGTTADARSPEADAQIEAARDAASTEGGNDGALSPSDAATQQAMDSGAQTAPLDAALDASPGLDAQARDASLDSASADSAAAATPDAGSDSGACPNGASRDACGVCGGRATSCHPLFGRYTARTQLYARQRSELAPGTPDVQSLDLVNKGELLSVVEIDAQGRASEHYCLLELGGRATALETDIASWTKPSASQRIPDTSVQLELSGGRYVRPLAAHRAYFGWLADGAPANCVAGQPHSSGCVCPSNALLPSAAKDCRVRDPEQDGVPGGNMYLTLGSKPSDPEQEKGLVELRLAAVLSFGWSLPATSAARMIGGISGGFQLSELSRAGDVAALIGPIENTGCPENLGHIELVRNEGASCAALLAGRTAAPLNAGVFDVSLDAPLPATTACTGAGLCVGTVDACGKCNGPGIAAGKCDCEGHALDVCGKCNGTGLAAGTCDCKGTPDSLWYADTDGDGLGDPASTRRACTAPAGYVANHNDTDLGCAPGKRDTCGKCNGTGIPAGACDCAGAAPRRWYEDRDGDGLGDPAITLENCTQPTGFVSNATDPYPTCKTAPDACGKCGGAGIPAGQCDCQGHTLDVCKKCGGTGFPSGTCDCAGTAPRRWYDDTDGDGQGNPAIAVDSCAKPTGFVDNASDRYPSCRTTPDVCGVCGGAGIPAGKCNCQGQANDACGVCGGNGSTCAGCDGVPNSGKKLDACRVCGGNGASCAGCDGVAGSGKIVDACGKCGGTGVPAGACNCAGALPTVWYADADRDGLGDPAVRISQCAQPAGYVNNASDADPSCAVPRDVCGVCGGSGFPAGTCDCTGRAPPLWYRDADNDTLGDPAVSQSACTQPSGYVANHNDTDPTCAGARDVCKVCNGPGIPAGKCNCAGAVVDACGQCGGSGIPQGACDCSGRGPTLWYGDADKDKLGDPGVSTSACSAPSGYVSNANDTDPTCGSARDACGVCGGTASGTCPLLGSYAVRTSVYSKQRNGSTIEQTKAINYSLVTVVRRADGQLELTDKACWNQTIPNGGSGAYSWSKPAWVAAVPAAVRVLSPNSDGTFTRPAVLTRYGWNPARQPAACSGSSTPVSPWPSAWGSTCTCSGPADALPPYDKNSSGFDCRLLDSDGDGQPGLSGIAATSAPSSPDANAPLLGATAYAAGYTLDSWRIALGANGRHTANIDDKSVAQVVGCNGLACSALPSSPPPPGVTCPPANNRAFFIPVSGTNASCSAVISQRDTLFAQSQDAPWPSTSTCPDP